MLFPFEAERLLRPNGRVVVIDGFWFAQSKQEEPDLFKQHYMDWMRESLPAMSWERVELAADLLRIAGFSEVTTGDLADIHDVADHLPSAEPLYVITGRRDGR